MELRETHARMEIRDHVARKTLRMVFFNTQRDPMSEAEFFMELEPDQKVESFEVTLSGKKVEGEILDAEKARKIYEAIVAKQKDPALLEYYGSRLLRVRVFPIPPNSQFEIEVRTVELLKPQSGLVRVQTLNAVPASFRKPLTVMTVEATVETNEPLLSVFSPTHDVVTERLAGRVMRMTYARKGYLPAGPFSFYYATGESSGGAAVLAHREPGEDGSFLLTVAPPPDGGERLPRDIVFAIDLSGSMTEADKIGQVRKALKTFVASLDARDRFNFVTFATEALRWKNGLVEASPEMKQAATDAVDRMRARGGTNIEDALRLALGHEFRPDATRIVVFLTDGVPTVGERKADDLVKIAAGRGVRVFSFGVGFDLDTQLLDRLALENGGDRQYIHPQEDASAVLEAFAKRIDAPVMGDVEVRMDRVTEVYPKKLGDLFRGGSLMVTGRWSGEAPTAVTLVGTAAGKRVERTMPVTFAPESRNGFVLRLWAIQKVDFLLDQIRRHGDSKELVEEIVALSKQYGIVTPYTAGLIVEDGVDLSAAVRERLEAARKAGYNGAEEWANVRNQQTWRGANTQERQQYAQNEALGRGQTAEDLERTLRQQRNVGSRAFYNRGGNWSESGYDAQAARVVKFDSDDYWSLLRNNPEAGAVLALGRNVTFRHNNEWVRVE